MEPVKVALLQIKHHGKDRRKNMMTGEEFCRKAKELEADIVLFPEMWSIGYSLPMGDISENEERDNAFIQELSELAVDEDHEFVRHYRHLAQELGMAIAITYLRKNGERLENSVSIIDRSGEIAFTYSKVHTCAFSKGEFHLEPGKSFIVKELETAKRTINIGAMICFDREFPESARILALKDADIILVPNCCHMKGIRTDSLKSRAFENMVGIALANYPAPTADGHSLALNGIAFDNEEMEADMIIAQGDSSEQIVIADFDIDKMRNYRAREVWGKKYPRPQCYGELVLPKDRH